MRKIFLLSWAVAYSFMAFAQGEAPKREFRGVWIATVANTDWPSRPGLPVEEQKRELLDMLDILKGMGMNAIIFQVRPAADAFYYSAFEPWSEYLMGVQGKGPDPFYDPLSFAIEACHDRGMELHAWVNPFRAQLNLSQNRFRDPRHVSQQHPDWVLPYGDRSYLDPGNPDARDYVLRVLMDIVYRYDIDGLHIDDYFYPYRIQGEEFPDSLSYNLFGRRFINKGDWRRANVTDFVRKLRSHSQALKPWVKFGISPFGVWRNRVKDPRGSDTRAGQTSFDDLYADIRSWMEQGWIDYVAPQIYWSREFPAAPYTTLLDWWLENSFESDLYVGKAAYKIDNNSDANWENPSEMPAQIRLDRSKPEMGGSIFFNAQALLRNPLGIADSLQRDLYASKALPPEEAWVSSPEPQLPTGIGLASHPQGAVITWDAFSGAYVGIYRFRKKAEVDVRNASALVEVVPSDKGYYLDRVAKGKYTYILTGLNRQFKERPRQQLYRLKVKRR